MVEEILKTEAFKLKGRLYTLTVLNLLSSDIDLFLEQLESTVASAPRLFDNTPVILDCSLITDSNFDLLSFCQSLRKFNMVPIAIQGGNSDILNLAKKASLPVLFASTNHDKSIVKETKNQQEEVALEVIKTKLLSQPVRSGQQIASKEGDLVIVSSVSHGAELLADGNIHVYGALRGRALAGIGGNKQARIFCQSLDAELVAIAGIYCLSESMPKMKSPCQIFLKDDKIQIENL